jgi:L-ascorbate metabolism protein UlaG (beta-lactamase superfamily)
MARSPNLFQATIAMSPSFTWNQFEWLDQAEAMFGDMPAWKHFLIVTEEPKSEEQARRVREFEEIVKAEAPAGFEYRHARFPDENHGTMALPGLYHSLKQLFDGWALVGEAWQIGPDGVRAHYEGLAERYGFAVPIPEDYLVDHALHGLHSHDAPDEAIALLEFCLELYPDSAAAREALEEAYAYKDMQDGSPQEASAEPLTVWYLGHSGFAVRVGEKLLVFDYWSSGGTPSRDPEAGGLTDGIIEAADLEGLEVYVFVSHSHSDHYDPTILEWESDVDNITYFFGWDAGDNPEHHYFLEPRATAEVDGIEVYTIYSHHSGVAEVAYLVHVDDRWIYHNGDYLQDYIPDFQYLESLTDHLDLVFTGGSHDERWQYTHQVQYLLEHFHPEVLFPMHYGDEEEKGDEFARVMKERGYETVIPVPRARGDRWVIEG